MCGIAGILRIGEKPLPTPETARRMIGSIGYRGPDERGEYRDQDIHLVAARLSILDLENGHQPAITPGGRTVAVQNGEIYNFQSLLQILESRGHKPASRGDTIVLPHLYEEFGTEMTQRLRGMYAFAVWDRGKRELLLCRDRVGIKPLYIAQTNDFLIFGSEIKAILASGLVDAALDRAAIDDLFSMSYPCPPRTMFRAVQEIRPAHRLTVKAGRKPGTPERYWRAPYVEPGRHLRISRRDAEVELRERLRQKVEEHLVSDVPVATYLSGGLDSSAITALVAEITGEPPATFSIGFTTAEHDERSHAQAVADHLGAKNHVITCGPETAEAYPDVVYHMELPLQYPLALPMTKLSGLVRSHGFPVTLTGEGADEMLAGYDCFRSERLRRVLERSGLSFLKPSLYKKLYGWLGSPDGISEFFCEAQQRPAREVESAFSGIKPSWYDAWTALDIDRELLLSAGGHSARPIHEAPEGFDELVRDNISDLHPVDAALALEFETRLPSWILQIGDRASMANSVEARVPLLDHELVEWVAMLPPSYKLRGFEEKSLLRGAVRDLLPEEIHQRRKQPFYTPLKQWFFSKESPAYVGEMLNEKALRETGYFEPSVVSRLRSELERVPDAHMLRNRIEWILVLVLGTQLLHHRLVAQPVTGEGN